MPTTSASAEFPAVDVPSPATPAADADLSALVRAQNAFGLDLYAKLRPAQGNFVVSPASIGLALGMTYLGARGDTAAEMKKTMKVSLEAAPLEQAYATLLQRWLAKPEGDLELRIANRLFVEKTLPIEAAFLGATKSGFGAPAERVDFVTSHEAVRQRVNRWVSDQTHERIVDLVPKNGVTEDTRLVLTNALYFKGVWDEPFSESATKPAAFYVAGKDKRDVPTMNLTRTMALREHGEVRVLSLGYRAGSFEMAIVLPKKRDGLGAIEAALDGKVLEGWFDKEPSWRKIQLSLPKFKLVPGETLRLKEALVGLGMNLAFDRDRADFTAIAKHQRPEDRLLISEVFHKAFVEVNEKGTEAAAATAVSMARAGGAPAPEEPEPFRVEHPFLFLIRDHKSGAVLFVGRVNDPG
jgi:serpin B